MAQMNFKNTGLPHACLIIAPSRELALSEAYKLAAAAVCSTEGARPCGECRNCRKAQEHVHPDIVTVARLADDKGKKKREISVEQVRELIREAAVLPNEAERKVFVIDEAETMNVPAQNAALKLLEEPPKTASFLLCTGNAAQLLPTVRSRCAEIICTGKMQGADKELLELSKGYVKAVSSGNLAELLRWCFGNEGMKPDEALAFVDAARALTADMLCSRHKTYGLSRRELMHVNKLLEKCAAMLRLNTGVKHIFGLLAVDSIAGDGNRG